MYLTILLSLIVVVISQTYEEPACMKLSSVYELMCPNRAESAALTYSQGPPGKRGAVGEKGEMGLKGERGAKGNAEEPNYETVREIVFEGIQEVLDIQMRNVTKLSSLLAEVNEKLQHLGNKTDFCPVQYNGTCFWVEYRGVSDVTLEEGKEICSSRGGKAANIYSTDHFYIMLGYLEAFARRHGYASVWTGMTYNSQNQTR